MSLLTTFLIGTILGLIFNLLLTGDFWKKKKDNLKNRASVATKEDIHKIVEELEKIKKHIHQNQNNYNLAEAEKEFYDENGIE